jgi:hypothetical protein
MVRFSDMLGGSGDPDDANAADSPYAALASDAADAELEDEGEAADGDVGTDAAKEPVPIATFETPEAVLDRLTQYATSRAADQTQAEAEPQLEAEAEPQLEAEPDAELEAEPDNVLPPVGDDFLPKFEGLDRKPGRGRRRHP